MDENAREMLAAMDEFNESIERAVKERSDEMIDRGIPPYLRNDDGVFVNVSIIDDIIDSLATVCELLNATGKTAESLATVKVASAFRVVNYVAAGRDIPKLSD